MLVPTFHLPKKYLFLLLRITLILTAFGSCFSSCFSRAEANAAAEVQYSIGESAPDFTLPNLEGQMVSFSSLKGKIVVIHFATAWCPFCNTEAPYLEKLYQNYNEKGWKFLL